VQLHGESLEQANGLYSPVATMINFLLQLPHRADVMGYVLQILKRLFNLFPPFRRNLEEPIIAVFSHIYCIYKSEADFNKERLDQDNMPKKYKEAKTLVVQAQIFYNFLLDES
jgi:hypothetical protein